MIEGLVGLTLMMLLCCLRIPISFSMAIVGRKQATGGDESSLLGAFSQRACDLEVVVERRFPAANFRFSRDAQDGKEAVAVARQKAAGCAAVQWRIGMGDALVDSVGADSADTVVSSLVLHQCPLPMKRAVLASMFQRFRPPRP